MAYCTITELSIHGTPAGKSYSGTTRPTSAEVTGSIIPYVYRHINGRLDAVGVTTPIIEADSPEAYATVKDLNALGAASKALRIAYTKQDPNKSDWVDDLRKEYKDRLDEICKNPAMLKDHAGYGSNVGLSGTDKLWNVETPDKITEHRFYRGHDW